MNNNLIWYEEHDDKDNSIWEAPSPYHDDGSAFMWRLKQEQSVTSAPAPAPAISAKRAFTSRERAEAAMSSGNIVFA